MRLFRKTRLLIKNIRLWLPILKEDQQWDYVYLYEVMKHKLELMEDLQRTVGNSVDAQVYADEMRLVIDALDRLIEEDYLPPEANDYYENITVEEFINRKEMTDEEREQHIEWFKKEEASKDKDRKFVFEYMEKNIERWWD